MPTAPGEVQSEGLILGVESALHARVVEALDVVEHIGPGVSQGQVSTAMHALALEQAEEALHRCIVAAVADRTHAAGEVMVFQELLVIRAGELRAAIRVQDYRVAVWALPARHHHRLEHHVSVLHRGHRPAHDLVREQVQHCT